MNDVIRRVISCVRNNATKKLLEESWASESQHNEYIIGCNKH